MAYRSNNYQTVTGYPALLWLTLREMAVGRSRIGDYLNQLFHVYSFTEAMLPSKKTDEEQAARWTATMQKIDQDLDQALTDYNPLYELPDFSPEEAKYRRRLFNILRDLNNLICDAKLIDKEYQREQSAPNPLLGDD